MIINTILRMARRVSPTSLSKVVATTSLALATAFVATTPTANAATTIYTDRAAFEAALSAFSVDNLDGIPSGSQNSIARTDFTITSPSGMFGCLNNPAQCGSFSGPGVDAVHFHHYLGADTFTFNLAIHGLGFDFFGQEGGVPSIDGNPASGTSGFFGIVADVAKTTFSFNTTANHMKTDNITYGVVSAVPLPAGLPFLLVALGGLRFVARRRKVA